MVDEYTVAVLHILESHLPREQWPTLIMLVTDDGISHVCFGSRFLRKATHKTADALCEDLHAELYRRLPVGRG